MALTGPVTFFSPNRVLGGTEMVFARLGALLEARGVHVRLLDIPDGTLSQLTRQYWKPLEPALAPPAATAPGWLVTTPKYLSHILSGRLPLSPQTRILIYQVHPMEWAGAFYPGMFRALARFGPKGALALKGLMPLLHPLHPARIRKALRSWSIQGGLCYMDAPNMDGTRHMLGLPDSFSRADHLLPLIAADQTPARGPRSASDTLEAFYFGRVSDFKVPIILQLVKDLHAWSGTSRAVRLSLIGDGDGMDQVKELGASLPSSRFSMEFLLARPLAEAQAIMAERADVVFAMGSSALDAGISAIPTVLINTPARRGQGGAYASWLHDQLGYSLGGFDTGRYSRRPVSIAQACDELGREADLGERSRAYVLHQHGAHSVAQRFVDVIQACHLKLEDLIRDGKRLGPARWVRDPQPFHATFVG